VGKKRREQKLGPGEGEIGLPGLGCWTMGGEVLGWPLGFGSSFLFYFLYFQKPLKLKPFEFKFEFEFKPHSNK
jgi:hypothetical protein